MEAPRDDRTDAEREMWKKISQGLKPDPATGALSNSDIFTFMREHENDPEFQSLLENSRKRHQEREDAIDFDTFDFASLARERAPNGLWRVRMEYQGLIDPETDIIVEAHMTRDYPDARHRFRLMCDAPGEGRHGLDSPTGEVDTRLVTDFEGIPKSADVLLFVKKAMVAPISCFHAGLPNYLRLTHDMERHRGVLAPFLDSIASSSAARGNFTWEIESAATAERMGALTYAKAKHFYEQNKAAGIHAKERGNVSFRAGNTKRAIERYTEALRRFEDAHCQKVLEAEKDVVMKLMAITVANRSAAVLLPGETRDLEQAVNDAKKAVFADPLYAKGYARLSKAYEASGDLSKAQDALAEGLRVPELENEVGLVDMLIHLQTGGLGLPEDAEEFLRVSRRIIAEDFESAERVKDIRGLWRERLSRN